MPFTGGSATTNINESRTDLRRIRCVEELADLLDRDYRAALLWLCQTKRELGGAAPIDRLIVDDFSSVQALIYRSLIHRGRGLLYRDSDA